MSCCCCCAAFITCPHSRRPRTSRTSDHTSPPLTKPVACPSYSYCAQRRCAMSALYTPSPSPPSHTHTHTRGGWREGVSRQVGREEGLCVCALLGAGLCSAVGGARREAGVLCSAVCWARGWALALLTFEPFLPFINPAACSFLTVKNGSGIACSSQLTPRQPYSHSQ